MKSIQAQHLIVVGTDGSTAALNAVRWAAREATRRQVPLRIVHVAPSHEPDPVYGAPDVDRDYGEAALLAAAAAAVEEPEYPLVQPVYRQGNPESVLRREAATADLLVVGSVGVGMLGALVLGSTAAELAATAPCPVAVITSHHLERRTQAAGETTTLPVVAILNGSEDIWGDWDDVIAAASEEARARHTSVVVASSDDAADAEGGLATRITRWQAEVPGVRLDSSSQKGNLTALATSLAKAAQLTVVGPPEHERLPLIGTTGRTVHALLHESDTPVMIIRTRPAPQTADADSVVSGSKTVTTGIRSE